MGIELEAPKQDLIRDTRDSIQHVLFQNPNEIYISVEPQRVGYSLGGKIVREGISMVEVGRLTPKEAHRVQNYGLFQLWSRMVDLAGIEQANFWTFGIIFKDESLGSTGEKGSVELPPSPSRGETFTIKKVR